ncbi:MAG: exodeoxyribonuclease VII small subunit [Candidatus Eisenbacteria bacterium]
MSKRATFEEDMGTLEELVEKLEQNELPLEDSIKAFEDGMKLAGSLMKTLEKAQERVRKLTKTEQGTFELEEFGSADEDE